jgi:hypothetical protein
METNNTKRGDMVTINGEDWRVENTGTTVGESTYVHLISLSRTVKQRNGIRPISACGWLRGSTLSVNP